MKVLSTAPVVCRVKKRTCKVIIQNPEHIAHYEGHSNRKDWEYLECLSEK